MSNANNNTRRSPVLFSTSRILNVNFLWNIEMCSQMNGISMQSSACMVHSWITNFLNILNKTSIIKLKKKILVNDLPLEKLKILNKRSYSMIANLVKPITWYWGTSNMDHLSGFIMTHTSHTVTHTRRRAKFLKASRHARMVGIVW